MLIRRLFSTALLLLTLWSGVLAQPDARDSVILESKTVAPGAHPGTSSDTAAYLYVKVFITNKDTLANVTLPVEIRSLSGGAFAVLGYPRNFNGTASRLTPTLGSNLTFSSFVNSTSPDTALWAGFWDPTDTATAEPPNAFRKAFWELKFDSVRTNSFPGTVQIDSTAFFDNRVGFVIINGNPAEVNFVRGIFFADHGGCDLIINCAGAGGNVLFGRSYTFDFDADCPGRWSVFIGPGSIDSITGIYTFSGQCGLGSVAVTVRYLSDFFTFTDCSFVLDIIDNPPSCSPAQNTVTVSHGETATNQLNATDPDAGDGFVFSKLSGPGAVNSSGAWSYTTSCADVSASPLTVQIQTNDAFGSCNPGPGACISEFRLIVTNAVPTIANCPTDVLPVDTGSTFSLQLVPADADPADAGNLLFYLVSAPAGFSVSSSGLVHWTPTGSQWGLRSAVVQVRDLCGAVFDCSIDFAVALAKGDLNADGQLTAADFVLILNCVFLEEPPLAGRSACDMNCNGELTPADVILLMNYLFLGSELPC